MSNSQESTDTSSFRGLLGLLIVVGFLALAYGAVVRMTDRSTYIHDELRYTQHADRIAQGKWTTSEDGKLRNGPLFPVALVGLQQLGQPYSAARPLNAVLMISSLIILYLTFRLLEVSQRWSVCGVAAIGLYAPIIKDITFIQTEVFSFFLICGFSYFFLHSCRRASWVTAVIAAVWLAALCLNRVIFGWAVLAGLVFLIPFLMFSVSRAKATRASLIFAGCLVLCIPYLSFTYSVTGKVFCWATNGGELLYWMASPIEGEYGNWLSIPDVMEHPVAEKFHGETFRRSGELTAAEKDEFFTEIAMGNLRQHPEVFVKHWIFNISRLLYNNPRSYVGQDPKFLLYLFPHTLLLFSLLGSLPIAWRYRASIPLEVYWLMGFALIYLGGITLLPATPRSFSIIVPILAIWVLYLFCTHVRVFLVPSGPAIQRRDAMPIAVLETQRDETRPYEVRVGREFEHTKTTS